MVDFFKKMKKITELLEKDGSDKKYWENHNVKFDTIIDPYGNYVDEKSVYEMFKQSDIARLKKYS